MRPKSDHLTTFAHVIREGSFSRAAERLGITQSAVTQKVTKLEQQIGSRLIHRDRDGVAPTRAGQEFYDLADRMLTLQLLVHEKIDGYASMKRGQLTVIANAPRPALTLIEAFLKEFPEIEISFTLHDWTRAMELLRTRQVDVAIVTSPNRLGDCYTRQIGEAKYVAYLRSNHPLAARPELSLKDLLDEMVLVPEEGSFTERILSRTLDRHEIVLRRRMRATTFPLLKEAVLHGVGIGIFLEDSGYPLPELVCSPLIEMSEACPTVVAVPSDKIGLRLVRSFVDLAEQLSPG